MLAGGEYICLPHRPLYSSSKSSSSISRGGKSPASHLSGRTKAPQLVPHSKYRLPLTEPSFLPVGSSNVTPIQTPMPGISGTRPMYDIVPRRASVSGSRRTRPWSDRPIEPRQCDVLRGVHVDLSGHYSKYSHSLVSGKRKIAANQPAVGEEHGANRYNEGSPDLGANSEE